MKNPRRLSNFSSSTTTTVVYTFHDDHIAPLQSKEIPVESPPPAPPSNTTLSAAAATARIQSAYRSHLIRGLYKRISSVNREADRLQSLIQRQETVDAIRSDERERLWMNESLMSLLLKLDSVPGLDPTVREARRKVSRRIVGLQEILDSISEARDDDDRWLCYDHGSAWPIYWEEAAEEEMCRERGGEDLERFCAQYLGFRCFQRFLRD